MVRGRPGWRDLRILSIEFLDVSLDGDEFSPLRARNTVPRGRTSHSWGTAPRWTLPGVAVVDDSRTRRRKLVGRNIALGRRLVGISQLRLSESLDMERSEVSKWENGVHEPSAGNIERIALALDKPVWWFYAPHDESDLAAG
jgi:hypothetical protein